MFTNNQIDVGALPQLENLNLKPIDSKYLYIILINILSVFFGLLGGLFIARWISNDRGFRSFALVLLVIIGLIGVMSLTIYYLGFKNRKYAIREQDMTYTQGYIVTKMVTLPYNRIQHLEIKRSFLSRKFGLSTLKIYSAGESGGDLSIKGLPKDVAERQYAYLTQIINERV